MSPRNPQSPVRETNLWLLDSPLECSVPLECHLNFVAGLIDEKLDALRGIAPFAEIEICCGYSQSSSQGGFVITDAVLKSISKLSIHVKVDVYAVDRQDRQEHRDTNQQKHVLSDNSETALMLAVQGRRISTIEALIETGASLELQNTLGWTAMTYAVIEARGWDIHQGICWPSSDTDCRPMSLLASAGARMGLREAILLGDVELARRICDDNASLDFSGSAGFAFDQTYLMLAAHLGDIAVVKFLLSRGADIEGKDDIDRTALMRAAEMGHLDVVSELLDAGAQINAGWPDETAFSAARRRAHEAVASLLRSRGAKVTLLDAVETSDDHATAELLRDGADANDYELRES